MPNWCHTNINIYSENLQVIFELHAKIKYFAATLCHAACYEPRWMGNLLMHTGCSLADIKAQKYGYVQGYIMDIDDCKVEKGIASFSMDISDKWTPDIKAVTTLLKRLFPQEAINLAYTAEEPGLELFEKYDPDDLFYNNYEYYVDYDLPDEDCLALYPEIIQEPGVHTMLDLISAFGTDSFENIERRCGQITEELLKKYQDGCYAIHRYEILETI